MALKLIILRIVWMIFDQESILFVDADRKAELHFPSTNKAEKLGNFVAVTKGIEIQWNNYTQDGQDYYVCDLAGVA